MKRYPTVFTIAGSDCIGGNGALADIKTISALGAYSAMAVTALTVGNTMGLKFLYPIPPDVIKQQIETVIEDIIPDVVKLGLLNDVETINIVGDCLRKYHLPYVVYDPGTLSTDDTWRMLKKNIDIVRKELLPFVNLIIISDQEAELLCEIPIETIEDMQAAAKLFTERNQISVLIKGRDRYKNELYDILHTPADEEWVFKSEMIHTHNSNGASCTLSSAIATYIALGHKMPEAVSKAREFVREAIQYGDDVFIGHGKGPVCQTFNPRKMILVDN